MEHLWIVTTVSFLYLAFRLVTSNDPKGKLVCFILISLTLPISIFGVEPVYLLLLSMIAIVLSPIVANLLVFVISLLVLSENKKIYGDHNLELNFNIKKSYSFLE